jgi:DNA-directed RNA polymerase II subunit RPB1
MSGREGVIDTAVKTAKSGYMQRKLVKAAENCITKLDGTVRNSDGSILQFCYGDDGFDGTKIEKQTISEWKNICQSGMNPIEFRQLMRDKEFLENVNKIREPIYKNTDHWMLPVPVDRIIKNSQTLWSLGIGSKLTQADIYDTTSAFIHTVENDLLRAFFRIKLNSCKLFALEVTDEHLEKIIFDMNESLETSKIVGGEPVGSVAAQSIGEYVTQMTLNTFHNTGNSAMNVTLGIPRLTELIDCVAKIQTPVSSFYCSDPNIKLRMQMTRLEDIVEHYKVTDEPDESEVESFYLFPDGDFKQSALKETLVLYLRQWYDVESVKKCLQACKNLSIAYTEGPYPIFHVKFVKKDKKKTLGYFYEQVLKTKIIRGVDGADVVQVLDEGDRFKIQTSLTDLRQIWALGIAQNSIETNDVHSVFEILGVEAARKKLIDEINNILAFYGLYVNARHILVIVDWMTFPGKLIPLTRHGIKEVDQSPIKRATFEEIINVFNKAATLNQTDELKGMSERILVGAAPFIGANVDLDVINDMDIFNKYKQEPPKKENVSNSGWENPQDDEDEIFGDMPWISMDVEEDPWADERQPWEHHTNAMPTTLQNVSLHQPQFHPNGFAQSFSAAPPPPMLTHHFATMNQQQMVANSSMHVSLFHNETKPPSPVVQSYGQGAYNPMGDVPMSPAYDPEGPKSPAYDPFAPLMTPPQSPAYSPTSPCYSPTSPCYSPRGESSPTQAYDPDDYNPQKKRRTFFE